jgi:hypothetical protein
MSNPPGVSVSQIATQLEAFNQMRIELVSFPDTADVAPLSPCAWQRGMGGHSYHRANHLLQNYQIYPGRGAPWVYPAQRSARNRSCCSCTVGQEILILGRSADLGCHQWLSG